MRKEFSIILYAMLALSKREKIVIFTTVLQQAGMYTNPFPLSGQMNVRFPSAVS